jgi:hypothetical protein
MKPAAFSALPFFEAHITSGKRVGPFGVQPTVRE